MLVESRKKCHRRLENALANYTQEEYLLGFGFILFLIQMSQSNGKTVELLSEEWTPTFYAGLHICTVNQVDKELDRINKSLSALVRYHNFSAKHVTHILGQLIRFPMLYKLQLGLASTIKDMHVEESDLLAACMVMFAYSLLAYSSYKFSKLMSESYLYLPRYASISSKSASKQGLNHSRDSVVERIPNQNLFFPDSVNPSTQSLFAPAGSTELKIHWDSNIPSTPEKIRENYLNFDFKTPGSEYSAADSSRQNTPGSVDTYGYPSTPPGQHSNHYLDEKLHSTEKWIAALGAESAPNTPKSASSIFKPLTPGIYDPWSSNVSDSPADTPPTEKWYSNFMHEFESEAILDPGPKTSEPAARRTLNFND